MEQLWVGRGREGVLVVQKTETEFLLLSTSVQGVTRGPIAALPSTLENSRCGELVEAKLRSGEHHWRIWRTGAPGPNMLGDAKRAVWLSTVRATRMIYDRMNTLFAAVEPSPSQRGTFGFLQREIIVLACTEVESAWRSVLSAHTTPIDPGSKRWSTKDYVRLLKPMRLDEWTVSLSVHRDFGPLSPFKGWDDDKPTQSLPWYDAYNAVKHGREDSLHCLRSRQRSPTRDQVRRCSSSWLAQECSQSGLRHPNRVRHPNMLQCPALAQRVHGRRTHAQPLGDLTDVE